MSMSWTCWCWWRTSGYSESLAAHAGMVGILSDRVATSPLESAGKPRPVSPRPEMLNSPVPQPYLMASVR